MNHEQRNAYRAYLKKHPYRKKSLRFREGARLLAQLGAHQEDKGYWRRFGYELAGPVCYAFMKWLADTLEEFPEVTDIAFVARDGWLLKQIYDLMPHGSPAVTRYIYASRAVAWNAETEEGAAHYREYLRRQGFGGGTLAVVDSITTDFSSIGLLSALAGQPVRGFYWVVVRPAARVAERYAYHSFQAEEFQVIHRWILMEFFMSSPEPPVRMVRDGQPVYAEVNSYELWRREIFGEMSAGALAFVSDLCAEAEPLPVYSEKFIVGWINDFLRHPGAEDRVSFAQAEFARTPDHSDNLPFDPFVLDIRILWMERLHAFSQKRPALYWVLHCGKTICKKLSPGRFRTERDERPPVPSEPGALAETLAGYDVVSFDVFDTLIRRPFRKPSDLFPLVGKRLGVEEFADVRIRAEWLLREKATVTGAPAEATIAEIYEELRRMIGISKEDGIRTEMETELECCYADPYMSEVFRRLRELEKPIILVSDMYLPAEMLGRILQKAGYTGYERLYISCEYRCSKYSGKLYDYVKRDYPDRKLVHIGDNFVSDVKAAENAGLAAVYYKRKK